MPSQAAHTSSAVVQFSASGRSRSMAIARIPSWNEPSEIWATGSKTEASGELFVVKTYLQSSTNVQDGEFFVWVRRLIA